MKKFIGVIFSLCLAFSVMGCASNQPRSVGIPSEVANARRNAPVDVLVGIGNAKMANDWTEAMPRGIATNRARMEISQTMNSMVMNMLRDYTAASEVDPAAAIAFLESMFETLSRSELVGSVTVFTDSDSDGTWWSVVYLSREDVAREINQAQAVARLAVPAMASFDANARMNEAFNRARAEGN